MRNSIAILLHHDAISGTSANWVAGDYMRIANEGSQRLLEISKELVDKLGKVTVEDKSVDLSKLS